MSQTEYEIKCYTRFSWGYIYIKNNKRREIWADSVDDLKRKVLRRNLPWNDRNVPKAKPTKIKSTYIGAISFEGTPASFRLPWCRSNYKRF